MDWDRATVLLIVAITAWRLQIIANPNSLLVAEEAQYWDWSRRPDFSYYSKPPLTSLLILLFTSVFGSTEFGIRLAPVGISLVLVGLTLVFLRDLGVSPRGRFFALLALALTPLFAAGSITMTTDTPLMLFWGTAVWALWRIHSRGWANGWYLVGLALGLGMLSKYTMAFLIPSVLGWLATSPRTRHHLASWRPLVALGIAVMLFSPVLYWNWANNWVTFKHVAADAGVQKGLRLTPMEFLEFLVGQAVVVSPVMFGLLFYVLWQVIRGGRTTERDRFLLWMALPVFVVYGAKALQDKVQANWPALSYYAWILLAVAHLDVLDRTHASRPWTRRWLRSTVMVALGLAFLMTYALMTPESIGPLSRRYQPAARMGDWRLLAREADRVRAAMPRPDRTFVFAREYQTAALMAFYMKGQPRVFLAPDRTRRMNQYDLWPSYGNLHCWDGIYIRSGTPSLLSGRIAYCFEDYGQPVTVAVDPQNQRPRMFTIIPAYGLRSELFNSEHPETY
jgi:4-amino-4-deoxy-L-arabinose transferase-like glycosyltransferase